MRIYNCYMCLENIDCMTYIDEVYRLEYAYNVWKFEFSPILDENM